MLWSWAHTGRGAQNLVSSLCELLVSEGQGHRPAREQAGHHRRALTLLVVTSRWCTPAQLPSALLLREVGQAPAAP